MSAAVGPLPEPVGRVVVLSAGGGDAAVAAEAAFAARVTGTDVVRRRRPRRQPDAQRPARPGRCSPTPTAWSWSPGWTPPSPGWSAATTDVPVVAVPTSTGQPGSFGGFGALLTMLNSSTPGVVVSNIDNGHAAGVFAARIARRRPLTPPPPLRS